MKIGTDNNSRCPECISKGVKPHSKKGKTKSPEKLYLESLTRREFIILQMVQSIIPETKFNFRIKNLEEHFNIVIPQFKIIIQYQDISNELISKLNSLEWKILIYKNNPNIRDLKEKINNLIT